jgi:uncharacterized membrane protein
MTRCVMALVLGLLTTLTTPAWPAPPYVFTTVDPPIAGLTDPGLLGVNNQGDLVGLAIDASSQDVGLVRRQGFWALLPGVVPQKIDDHRPSSLVGWSIASGTLHGFLERGGQVTTFDAPGSNLTEPLGLNNLGEVVGDFRSRRTGDFQGFLYDSLARTFTPLDPPAGGLPLGPTAVNDRGQIVGTTNDGEVLQGFLKESAAPNDFIPFAVPGALGSFPLGINNRGHIVGLAFTDPVEASGNRSFLWDGATFTTIEVPGALRTEVRGLNDHGQLVGRYLDAGGAWHGFLATPDIDHLALLPTVALERGGRDDRVTVQTWAILGADRTPPAAPDGVDVLLSLVGGASAVTTYLPPGSLREAGALWVFSGVVDGAQVEVAIWPGDGWYYLAAEAALADIEDLANPFVLTVAIGEDSGTVSQVRARGRGLDALAATPE